MATVLLATDGSDLATAAIGRGVALLGTGHDFVGLNVIPPSVLPGSLLTPVDAVQAVLPDPVAEAAAEQAEREQAMTVLAALATSLGVAVQHRVEIGEPGQTITSVAAEIDAAAIVLGTHGHGFWKRLVLGSVSQHVLHHAACPVLVCHGA